jgi:hypothetical protein
VDQTSPRLARLRSQGLTGPPARTPEGVVTRLLAVQAQDARGARLAIRARSTGLRAADVDDALTQRRSLVVTWLNRGTLHLVASEDYWWLHPLTSPQLATESSRRLGVEGVSPAQAERGVGVVMDAVHADGPQTRAQLRARLDDAGVPTARQALVHVLLAASLRDDLVRGPMVDGEHAFVSARDWLGPAPVPASRDDALARLGRRYLDGHAPADARDLAKWAGITLRDARRALDHADAAPPRATRVPRPRLLGAFDPLLLGWASRAEFVGEHRLVTVNGLFRPFALVDGRAVATWGLTSVALTVRLLEPLTDDAIDALRRDARDVLRYLDLPRDTPIAFEG